MRIKKVGLSSPGSLASSLLEFATGWHRCQRWPTRLGGVDGVGAGAKQGGVDAGVNRRVHAALVGACVQTPAQRRLEGSLTLISRIQSLDVDIYRNLCDFSHLRQ